MRAHVPFEVCIIRMKENFNFHDIAEALVFCAERSLTVEIIEIDAREFLESSKLWTYAERFKCASPMLNMHMYFLDKVDGIPIMGGNPPRIDFLADRFDICLPSEPHLALLRYFELQKRGGVPFFFLFTPELACSFFRLPTLHAKMNWIRGYTKNPDVSREAFYESDLQRRNHRAYLEKCQLYAEAGFSCHAKPFRKTGFDALRRFYALENPDLGEQAFEKIFRKPLVVKYPFPEKTLHLIHKADLGLEDNPISGGSSNDSGMHQDFADPVDS